MQPVPVQRSRMRRVLDGGGVLEEDERRRRLARWVVRDWVSGLWVCGSPLASYAYITVVELH